MTRTLLGLLALAGAAAALTGCPGPAPLDANGGNGGSGANNGTGGSGANAQSGLPCDVATILANNCLSCHGSSPVAGAPPLVTYDQLLATSPAGGSYAERALVRMKDSVSPMPPAPAAALPADTIAAYEAWVTANMPKGDCGAGGGGDPYGTPPTCTSGQNWTQGDEGSPDMHPGLLCVDCHSKPNAEGEIPPEIFVGGTVYPSAHEFDDCVGSNVGGATVEITDSMNNVYSMIVRASGNFMRGPDDGPAPVLPIKAKVVAGGKERIMTAAVNTGDCNSCHTLEGTGNPKAPGRIMAP